MSHRQALGRGALLALCCLLAASSPALADTITLTLDGVTTGTCDTVWNEQGLDLWFSSTTSEDLTYPYCLVLPNVSQGGNEGVYIYPARLNVDLSSLSGIETVDIDIHETHFAGSTRAFLYYQAGQVDYAQSTSDVTQTLTLNTVTSVDHLAVSAHESAVWEIRISGATLVSTEPSSWGRIKAVYR